MTSVFLDLDALDDDDVDEHMHDYAFVENSDDENFIDDSYVQDAADATFEDACDATVEDVFDGALNHAAFNNQVEAQEYDRVERQYADVMEGLRRPFLLRKQYEQHLALDAFAEGKIRGSCGSKGKGVKKRSRDINYKLEYFTSIACFLTPSERSEVSRGYITPQAIIFSSPSNIQKRSRGSMSTSTKTCDDESLTCRRRRTAEESLLNTSDSYISDCSEEASDVSENSENTRTVPKMSEELERQRIREYSWKHPRRWGTSNEDGQSFGCKSSRRIRVHLRGDNSWTSIQIEIHDSYFLGSRGDRSAHKGCTDSTKWIHGPDCVVVRDEVKRGEQSTLHLRNKKMNVYYVNVHAHKHTPTRTHALFVRHEITNPPDHDFHFF